MESRGGSIMKKLIVAVAFVLLSASQAHAATWYVKAGANPSTTGPSNSCEQADVNTALGFASVVDADILVMQDGSCTWTSGVSFQKAITLKATTTLDPIAGTGGVTITFNNTTADMISVTEDTGGTTTIRDIFFQAGTGPSTTGPKAFIRVTSAASGRAVLIVNNRFNTLSFANSIIVGSNKGVISGNRFVGTIHPSSTNYVNGASCVRHKLAGVANSVWEAVHTMGTADNTGEKNLYFENNSVHMAMECVDSDDNARTVVRFNKITNANAGTHGTDTSYHGARHFEVYGNQFIWDGTAVAGGLGNQPPNVTSFTSHRGGTGRWHNNSYQNIGFEAGWGAKTEVFLIFENARRDNPPPGDGVRGHAWECWNKSYPGPHQVGWGYITGATNVASDVSPGTNNFNQDLEPHYIWGLSGTFNFGITNYNPNTCTYDAAAGQTSSTFIQANRDYYHDSGASCPSGGACASGVGSGTTLPTSCSDKTAFWKTDEGTWNGNTDVALYTGQGRLYICSGGSMSLAYTPATYPHTLIGGGGGGGGDTTPPTVSITAPTASATVSGTISVTATASDDTGVEGVQFKLDGVNLQSEDTVAPYSISWDTTTASEGTHDLTAVARDAAGNSTISAIVTITVDNIGSTPRNKGKGLGKGRALIK
jgi:hypothetical protein